MACGVAALIQTHFFVDETLLHGAKQLGSEVLEAFLLLISGRSGEAVQGRLGIFVLGAGRTEQRDGSDVGEAERVIGALLEGAGRLGVEGVEAPLGCTLDHFRGLAAEARPVKATREGVIEARHLGGEGALEEVAPGGRSHGARDYAVKDVPQPQVPVALGFENAKPDPIMLSW